MEYMPDKLLAKQLLKMRIITKKQLKKCQEIQAQRESPLPLAFILIDKGYLNDENLDKIIGYQKNYFRYLAKYDLENLLGQELIEMGVITLEQLIECQEIQASQLSPLPIVFILGEKGYLNEETIQKIVEQQTDYFKDFLGKSTAKELGQICYEKGWITKEQLEHALHIQKKKLRKHGIKYKLGKILIKYNFVSEMQVQRALEIQGKKVLECIDCKKIFNVKHFNDKRLYNCPKCGNDLTLKPAKSQNKRNIKKTAIHPSILPPNKTADLPPLDKIYKKKKTAIYPAIDKSPLKPSPLPTPPDKAPQNENLQKISNSTALKDGSGKFSIEDSRQISKGVIAIEQALDSTEDEEAGAETSTTWWMARIDTIISKKIDRRDIPKVDSFSSTVPTVATKERVARPSFNYYMLSIAIGVILFLFIFILYTAFRNRNRPSPYNMKLGEVKYGDINNETSKYSASSYHKEGAYPTTQISKENLQGQEKKNDKVIQTGDGTPFQKEIENIKDSPELISASIDKFRGSEGFRPEDLATLKDLYERYPDNMALRNLAVLATANIKSQEAISWLEEVIQSGTFRDKSAAVESLKMIGGERVERFLLASLQNADNEQLVRYIFDALSNIAPQSREVFQEITNQFYQCQDLGVRNSLLRKLHYMKTGEEGGFLIRIISDQSVPSPLRITAVNVLLHISDDKNKKSYYFRELERIMEFEPENDFKKFLNLSKNSFSEQQGKGE